MLHKKISILLKSNASLIQRVYTVTKIDFAVSVEHVYGGKTQIVHVGDKLTEDAAQNLATRYHVTVT